jgi:hypothetical protein
MARVDMAMEDTVVIKADMAEIMEDRVEIKEVMADKVAMVVTKEATKVDMDIKKNMVVKIDMVGVNLQHLS